MKPRTKQQFEVVSYSQGLCDIRPMMLEWAKRDCLEHKVFATKTRVICMDCGERFSPELVNRKRAVCPHCGAQLKIENSKKRSDKQEMILAKAEICGEYQVIRNFELHAYYKQGIPSYSYIGEVMQHWIKDDGSREVISRSYNTNCSGWGGVLELRNKITGGTYSYYRQERDILPDKFHPESNFREKYVRYGIDCDLRSVSFLSLLGWLPNDSKIETLIKSKQYELIAYCSGAYSHKLNRYWPSIKICLRNKYRIKDISMWFDYLEMLEHYNRDLHNAFYVCPKSLKKAHDTYVARKARDDEKERRERDKQKILKLKAEAENYIKEKSKFFDLKITDGKIVVVVLKSVEEFMLEGEKMHHCVFSNEYFKKKNCLILSARIGNKRIETVEVDLKTLKIVQSRGVCNQNTEYHDRIIGLVRKNIGLIKQKVTAFYE